MLTDHEFAFLTGTGGRPSAWLRVWLTVAAVAAGAILLWLGLILVFAVVVAAALSLLPVWAWRWVTASRRSGGPATIEGEYMIAPPSLVEAHDEVAGRNSTRDAGR